MDFLELAHTRYSVRSYADRPVEHEKLEQVLEAGRLAPTAKNIQPVHVYVVMSAAGVAKMRSLTRCAFDAPVVLMVAYDRDLEWHNPFDPAISSGAQDATLVGTHMMMEATDLGLGTCWVNWFDVARVHDAFGLPERETLLFLMPLGYPSEKARPSERHESRKPLSDTVTEL